MGGIGSGSNKSPEVLLSRYQSLADAVAAAGSDAVTIQVDTPPVLTGNLVVPANIHLDWLNGNVMTGAYDFSTLGALTAGEYTLFSTEVNVTAIANADYKIEWWEDPSLYWIRACESSQLQNLLSDSGYVFGICDNNGNLAIGILPTGEVFVSNLTVDSLSSAILARILPSGVTAGIDDGGGYKFAMEDDSGNLAFGVNDDGTVWLRLDNVAKQALVQYMEENITDPTGIYGTGILTAWGDSMTAGSGGGGTTYTGVIASLLGRTVNKYAKGGQNSLGIAIRQGGRDLTVNISGNTIPASGGVAITSKNNNILYDGGTYTGTVHVTIAKVPGVISTDVSGNWTFTRDVAGIAVTTGTDEIATIDSSTAFTPAPAEHDTDTILIWSGRNGFGTTRADIVTVRDNISAMVNYLEQTKKNYLVISVCNGAGEVIGTGTYDQIIALNAELKATFGDNFVDVRSYLVNFGLEDAGITPTAQDLTDMSGDTIPESLRSDSVHLTATGYTLVGQYVARSIQAKSY